MAETGVPPMTSTQPSRTWTMLFRVFELARDPYKIIIAIGAVIALSIGWWILGAIFQPAHHRHGGWPANADRGPN